MSRFVEEVRLIRWPAWLVGVLLAIGIILVIVCVKPTPPEQPLGPVAKTLLSILTGAVMICFALVVGYVYADAKRRGMRYVMWTWLAALVPNAIGIILYFVLRDPLLVSCSSCGSHVRQNLAFCPQCGSAVGRSCPQCRRTIEPGWLNCAYCGAKLPSA
ncbi:MAG TPA: zinc ribbon domain-containing protein [Candidatus Acidoferrales bacterium]|nr:zinc ribbon domain-containing protein [Candidatus Acidoferrales bacterium]